MKKYLIVLIFIYIFFRLIGLSQIYLLHDERDIFLSGWSIARTGKDLYGNFLPLHFTGISPNNPLVAIYYSALWSFFIPIKSVFFARLPYVVISALLIPLVYQCIELITKNKRLALLTAIIYCFSPWVFHVTRLALDIPLAIVFLLAGINLYLSKKRFLSFIPFLLAFYTYQGFRLLIPPLLLYLELFFLLKQQNIKQSIKYVVFLLFFIMILLSSTLFIDKSTTTGRLNEIVFFNSERLAPEVDFRRQTSIGPLFLKKIAYNKLTVALDYVLSNFTKGQDITYLFKDGDYSAINANTAAGQFLFPFIIFYYAGLISLGKHLRREYVYLLGFTLITMVTSFVSNLGASFSIRAMPSGIGYAFIISLGILFLNDYVLTLPKRIKIGLISLFILSMSVGLFYFSFNFFLRRPVTIGELFNENERTLHAYLKDTNKQITIYHNSPRDLLFSLFFLGDSISIGKLQESLAVESPYRIGNIQINECDHNVPYTQMTHIVLAERCIEDPLYRYLNANKKKVVSKIRYTDISLKTAYFIIE